MPFRRSQQDAEDARRWRAFVREHQDLLARCGLPPFLTDSRGMFDHFLMHDYYPDPVRFAVDDLSPPQREGLIELVARYLAAGFPDPGLTPRLRNAVAAHEGSHHGGDYVTRATIEAVIARWNALDGPARPPPPASALDRFEGRHGVLLPEDLRLYFALCDGTPWPTLDRDWFRSTMEFAALEDVRPVQPPTEPRWLLADDLGRSDEYFIVADYLIASEVFSIRLTSTPTGGNPVVRGPHAPGNFARVADSLTGFLRRYLDDPDSLFG